MPHPLARLLRGAAAAVMIAAAVPAAAQPLSLEAQIAAALAEQGYAVLYMERTWLGRLRVVAEDATRRRELVFDPGSGEILNDSVRSIPAAAPPPRARQGDDDDDDSSPRVTALGAEVVRDLSAEQWVDVVDEPDGVTVDVPGSGG